MVWHWFFHFWNIMSLDLVALGVAQMGKVVIDVCGFP